MSTPESDPRLGSSKTSLRESQSNTLLLDIFGSVTPIILRRPHRLVVPATSKFRELMSVIGDRAGQFGVHPPSVRNCGPDYGVNTSPFESLEAWCELENQNHLAEQIGNFKYAQSFSLICSAKLAKGIVSDMASSSIGLVMLYGTNDYTSWFDTIAAFLDRCGWFYLPLPEYSRFDLFLCSEVIAPVVLRAIDSVQAPVVVAWTETKAMWPIDHEK